MRVVAKIGTASITDDRGAIDGEAITKLCGEVAALRAQGHELIVVSSGAVAAGVLAVGLPSRPSDMATLQAIVVPKGRTAQLAEVNRFLADVRKSGFVKESLDRAKVAGVGVAPEPK